MTTAMRHVTADELLAMGERSCMLELFEGELRTVSPANIRHGDIAGQIGMILRQYVSPRKLGRVIIEGGFILARNPDTVLGPDVSFISQSRVPPDGLREEFFDGHPDLAVEIISPTNPRRELDAKMKLYITHGTPLAWLVNPAKQTVDIYRKNKSPRQLKRSDIITGAEIIPEFSCNVADFFA